MRKTTFPAFIATFIISYLLWLVLTGQIFEIFSGKFDAEILIAGVVVCVLVALFCARFFIHKNPWHLFKPKRFFTLLYYCVIVFMWELIKANVNMALIALNPKLKIKPGFVKIPSEVVSEYGQAMLANSITLTPGTMTMDIVEEGGKTFYYIHWIYVESEDPNEAGEAIKGTMEKWIRRIWD